MSIGTNSVMWFRRDLRLADNEALVAAARAGSVTPLFVIDPMFFERSGAPRLAFLLRSLHELNKSMGSNRLFSDKLYKNIGDNKFIDVSDEAGVRNFAFGQTKKCKNSYSC